MIDSVKACVLTAYAPGTVRGQNVEGSPYKRGQERLIRSIKHQENKYRPLFDSLIHHGFRYNILAFDDWPNQFYNTECGYNIKAAAFDEAIKQGYERILWLDSSFWAIKPIEKLFDVIDAEGWYFWNNGFNMAMTANDDALKYFGLTRDQAEQIPDITTSCFGLHMGNPKAQDFLEEWLKTARRGMWETPRDHGGGSSDPRFLFDRQDQSCASIIRHKLGMHYTENGIYTAVANDKGEYKDSTMLVMRGL